MLSQKDGLGTHLGTPVFQNRSGELMRMQLEQYRLDRMPEIIGQVMKPAEKIDSIRIHQITGFGGSSTPGGQAGGDGGAARAPVTQVMDSILGMALQLPALKSIGESIGVDLSSAVGPASNSADPPSGGPASSGNKALPKG